MQRMQKNISNTIFYSSIFAMGGAPTIAMLIIKEQTSDPALIYQALVGLSVIIACILVPLILIQNAFLFYKRESLSIEQKIEPIAHFYFVLSVLCLLYWLAVQFFKI